MKYLLFLTLLLLSLKADDDKQKVTIGLGAYIQTQPYENIKDILVPTPVVFFDNSLFYIRWTRVGIYFLGDKGKEFSWGFSLTVQPRTYGYEPSDSKALNGMDKRDNSFEGGVAFSSTYHDSYLEVTALTDILGRYKSWVVKTELGYSYKVNNFSFYPSVSLAYQSEEFVNYYYGVKSSETMRTSYDEYSPDGGYQVSAQTYVNYKITNNFATLINIKLETLPQSAKNSPLVNDDYIYSGLVSLMYSFEY